MDIYVCCGYGDLKRLQELITEGANINEKDTDGWTPLHYASRNGHLKIVKKLIKYQANANVQNNFGNIPIYFAGSHGHLEIVKELIDHSDLSIKNNYGRTVLDVAKTNEIEQFIKDYLEFPDIKEPESDI